MLGLREGGLVGTALVLTGAVGYFIWNLLYTKKRREAEKETLKVNVNAEKEEKLAEEEVRSEAAPTVSQQGQERGFQVLVVGLDGAGKTSLLQCFATGSVEQNVSPTQGLHAISIHREELHIEFLEVGGDEKLRTYWPMYLKKARVLVFVLDSADSARFPLAKTSLHQLLASAPYLPLVLLANKQDLPGACGVAELYESMELESAGNGRRLSVLGTEVQKSSSDVHSSVQDAYELILDMMNTNC